MTTNIQDRALLVTLTLSMWNGQRIDPTTTLEVLTQRQADSDAGRFTKQLVRPKSLEKVVKAHTASRRDFYKYSLPWDGNGTGAIATAAFMDFSLLMQRNRTACNTAYDDFCNNIYPEEVKTAPKRMGPKLFNASDFPDVKLIRQKFGFKLFNSPIPSSAGFKGLVPDEAEEQELRAQFEAEVTDRMAEAQNQLWLKLFGTLKHFAETMDDSDKVFRNSTVSNLLDIAKLAPKLSIKPDSQLEDVCQDLIKLLNPLQVDVLRDDKLVRAETAFKAKQQLAAIEKQLAGIV